MIVGGDNGTALIAARSLACAQCSAMQEIGVGASGKLADEDS
jgi:hypothetical protein